MKLRLVLAGAGVALLVLAAGSGIFHLHMKFPSASTPVATTQSVAPTYVGVEACKACHLRQYQNWLGSDHQLAMQRVSPARVLGDFRDARFTYFGVTSRFFSRDGRYFVNTDGPDGRLHDYEILYTFGVRPLQQYLVGFPDGRLQALSIAWDSRAASVGGQRWFHLYPTENIRTDDERHWTNLQQNWNYMCAECHSTGVRKNYDEASNTYRTTWTDISVACEACHGAGSAHVSWAKRPVRGTSRENGLLAHFDDRRGMRWILDPAVGNSHRSRPRANTQELEMCARCHSRGMKISEDWAPGRPLLDTHRVALLDEGLYTADGQMQGEVYNYASFLQSRMFAAGVTCSDCHEPHSQKLRASNTEVCGLCHALTKYGSAAHHHHQEQSAGSRCVACHMSVRTYMLVDQRHDHGFRIPRPEESVKYGTPNACNDCHKDKTPAWAAQATQSWYAAGRPAWQHYTEALASARRQSATAAAGLLGIVRDESTPGIARATALKRLGEYLDSDSFAAARTALQSPDAVVRLAAVELLGETDTVTRWTVLSPLLADPVRAVRIAAAEQVADCVPGDVAPEAARAFQQALSEYVSAQKLNADRPEAHLNLGDVFARQGRAQEAQDQYQQAIRLWPGFAPAYINLADLSRARQQDDVAERWLTAGAKVAPWNADVLFALGLLRTRQHRSAESVQLLQEAAVLAPANAHYAYVYGVDLYSTGKTTQALEVLRQAHERFPGNRELLLGLASLAADSGDTPAARSYAERFVDMAPADPRGRQMLQQMQSAR
jgi:tetratricopeptide (TPR) repeat protein